MIESPARSVPTDVARADDARPRPSDVRRALRAASGAVVAVLALTVAVASGSTTWLDEAGRPLAAWATAQGLDPLLVHVEVVFGRTAMSFYAALGALALLAVRAPRLAGFTVVATGLTSLLTTTVKELVERARPEWQLTEGHHETFAFASGHASAVTALVGVLIVVTWTLTAARAARQTITSLVAGVGVGLVLVIAADRVLLGRHFPTDVLGGVLLGTVVVLLTAVAFGLVGERGTTPGSTEHPDQARSSRARAA